MLFTASVKLQVVVMTLTLLFLSKTRMKLKQGMKLSLEQTLPLTFYTASDSDAFYLTCSQRSKRAR